MFTINKVFMRTHLHRRSYLKANAALAAATWASPPPHVLRSQ